MERAARTVNVASIKRQYRRPSLGLADADNHLHRPDSAAPLHQWFRRKVTYGLWLACCGLASAALEAKPPPRGEFLQTPHGTTGNARYASTAGLCVPGRVGLNASRYGCRICLIDQERGIFWKQQTPVDQAARRCSDFGHVVGMCWIPLC
jgi:hypothetical protein